MNIYDLLSGYHISACERSFEGVHLYKSLVTDPYMVFNSTVSLTKNVTASVMLSKYNFHVQFFDMWSNDIVQVIFDSENGGNVSLFNGSRLLEDDCLKEYSTILDIPDYEILNAKLTCENLQDLERIYNELFEMFKKDETVAKYMV